MGNNCQCQDRAPVDTIVKGDPSRLEPRCEDTDSTGTPSAELALPTLETGTCDGTHGDVPKPGSPRWAQSENIQAEELPILVQPVPLTVTIVGTRGLRKKEWVPDSSKSCYCVLKTLKDQLLHTTPCIDGAFDPLWNEEVEFDCASGETLQFIIWDRTVENDGHIKTEKLGRAVLESKVCASLGFNGKLCVQDAARGVEAYLQIKVKSAGQEYPRGPPQEFTINLQKSTGKPMGADIDVSCGKMGYIRAVMRDGVFAEYNKTATPEKQLRIGDYIKTVNGIQDNSLSMLDCLKKQSKFEVTIQRPLVFTIAISKKGAKTQLGVILVEKPTGNSLLIKEVSKGPVMDWNTIHPEQEVKAGDRIVAVNGKGGTVNELVDASKEAAQLQLAISRPSTTRE
jgi:hypothetical protein